MLEWFFVIAIDLAVLILFGLRIIINNFVMMCGIIEFLVRLLYGLIIFFEMFLLNFRFYSKVVLINFLD